MIAKILYMTETFKDRMKRLRVRAGLKSQQSAAEAIGCERGTVGMWEAPSSAVDSISGDYLLAVARAYKVRPEYINTGKGDDGFPWAEEAEALPQGQSHPLKLDPEIVRKAGTALNLRYKKAGGYNLEERPEEFVRAYELWFGMDDAYEDPEVYNLVIRHADLSPQGASEHERGSEGAPPHGAPGEGVRAGRRR